MPWNSLCIIAILGMAKTTGIIAEIEAEIDWEAALRSLCQILIHSGFEHIILL